MVYSMNKFLENDFGFFYLETVRSEWNLVWQKIAELI